jgi:hypothetical protein
MVDFIMNLAVGVVWLTIAGLLIIRRKERRGLRYGISLLDDGMEFWYRLGVYAGTVRMIRDVNVKVPQLDGHVLGWECKFPTCFTNKEMCQYICVNAPTAVDESAFHPTDLMIFNEVVNRNNNGLVSIYGQIFIYDNSDYKPFEK